MKETAYLIQAALISAWWVGLATNQEFFAAFQFNGIPPVAFWAFFAPDIICIAALSTARAYKRIARLEYIVLGAFAYASLYCANATCLTRSGYLPTGVMLCGLCYNFFLCFNGSLFRNASSSFAQNVAKTAIQTVCIWTMALAVVPYIILDAFNALAMPNIHLLQRPGLDQRLFHGPRRGRHTPPIGSNQSFGGDWPLSLCAQSDGHRGNRSRHRHRLDFSIHTDPDLCFARRFCLAPGRPPDRGTGYDPAIW